MLQKNHTHRYDTRNESLFIQVWTAIKHQAGRSKAALVGAALVLALAFTFVLNGSGHREVLGTAMLPAKTAEMQANVPDQNVPEAAAEPLGTKKAKPEATRGRVVGSGEASYYGAELAGHETANGERFDPSAMTAAHRTLPLGSRVRVTNERNGRSVIVRVNDRGPYAKGRILDVSKGAARKLGMLGSGTAQVKLEVLPKTSARL